MKQKQTEREITLTDALVAYKIGRITLEEALRIIPLLPRSLPLPAKKKK